ncbi:hypothetical protein [Fimbriiglobus ruber]|uniref:Uncharacterized protein n=1 Tax=Fimbriiglobus ruber TaxID=1908690 RepID=A0A225DWL0_9BACT|nr:hypothetical protein [Fimbriiglobus ruber]OWK45782.1 hypothetical protein FRUB_02113 [Fimbriiglobus ruber]
MSTPTIVTSPTAYCDAAGLLLRVDYRVVADACRDEDTAPRPSKAALLQPTTPAGAVVAAALLTASGDVEAACVRGGRYAPTDLAALTGATQAHLQAIVAGLAVWRLLGRRQPAAADGKNLPLVQWARDQLEALRVGEEIFGVQAVVAAGAGMSATPFVVPGPRRTVNQASRYFGDRGPRG